MARNIIRHAIRWPSSVQLGCPSYSTCRSGISSCTAKKSDSNASTAGTRTPGRAVGAGASPAARNSHCPTLLGDTKKSAKANPSTGNMPTPNVIALNRWNSPEATIAAIRVRRHTMSGTTRRSKSSPPHANTPGSQGSAYSGPMIG